jgi:hypothetical protein
MKDMMDALGHSDMSTAALDAFGAPSWAWVQYFGANSLAHVALGAVAASACVAIFYGTPRGNNLRAMVGIGLLAGVLLKDFSQDYFAHGREPLVLLDNLWDAACYYGGWRLIEENSRIVAARTRAAVKRLRAMLQEAAQ